MTDASWSDFFNTHRDALALRTAEHLQLTGITVLGACILGIALAVLAYRRPALHVPLLALVGMLQTIPGIALLVMTMALLHRIGTAPALLALLLYALLPIVQNTLVGLLSLSPALAEAARGLGLSKWQRLRHVRLPLALPMILAGLRTSAVQTVGLATLAAFVGAGGLGQFINRGLFLSDTRLILLGAVPAALIALLLHGILSLLGMAAMPQRARKLRRIYAAIALIAIGLLMGFTIYQFHKQAAPATASRRIVIASKNFTEQLIVAEMVAEQIERTTHLQVERRFGLGGSNVIHGALTDGSVDIAVEYTGTALASILHLPVPENPKAVFPTVRDTYEQKFHLTWFAPLGFDNSYRLAIRSDDARLSNVHDITSLTQVAKNLTAAFDFEFAERPDGYKGLAERYGLKFNRVVDMHPDLLYPALLKQNADVISAYATDGRLAQPAIRTLADDQHFFPPYEAAIVARDSVIEAHPELKSALDKLSSRLTTEKMRALNSAVDHKQLTVEQAAARALGQ